MGDLRTWWRRKVVVPRIWYRPRSRWPWKARYRWLGVTLVLENSTLAGLLREVRHQHLRRVHWRRFRRSGWTREAYTEIHGHDPLA